MDKSTLTDIKRASRFLFLNKYSFAAKGTHYGYATTQPQKKIIESERIHKISERLANTYIESLHSLERIKLYDREETFFMVVLPYLETSLEFSFNQQLEFSFKEHEEFRNRLEGKKASFF